LGINTRELEFGHKKRARLPRVPFSRERGVSLARGWSLDQISKRRNPENRPSTGNFQQFGFLLMGAYRLAGRAKAPREGWRPGLDLNQDKERCTALALTRSATGPA